MKEEISRLNEEVKNAKRIVFFGGAGVSTESGIPDFRSVDGLYAQKYDYPPETILSHSFFMKNTEEFYKFYREKMLFEAEPNAAHLKLAEWEKRGVLTAVVTQNIDGLHYDAGSKRVFELHGSVRRNYCMKCGRFYPLEYIKDSIGVPKCSCGGIIKPDVVLYEEPLCEEVVNGAVEAILNADLMIVGGTSLTVYPAAGLLRYFKGKTLALVNRARTPMDDMADIVVNDSIGKVFSMLK